MISFIDSEVAYNNDIDGLHEKQAVSYDGFDLRSSLAGVQLRSVCTSEVQYHNEFLMSFHTLLSIGAVAASLGKFSETIRKENVQVRNITASTKEV
jgi:hypothetical protein